MGEITYQGVSPYRVIPAQPSTARKSGAGVEMTVFASVDGKPPDAYPIQVPMSPGDARQFGVQLIVAALEAKKAAR